MPCAASKLLPSLTSLLAPLPGFRLPGPPPPVLARHPPALRPLLPELSTASAAAARNVAQVALSGMGPRVRNIRAALGSSGWPGGGVHLPAGAGGDSGAAWGARGSSYAANRLAWYVQQRRSRLQAGVSAPTQGSARRTCAAEGRSRQGWQLLRDGLQLQHQEHCLEQFEIGPG